MGKSGFIVAFVSFYALFSMFSYKPMAEADDQNRKVHIVYLGERQHDDTKLTTESHHELLATILGSKEKSRESMVYSYRHGFSGFAAKLTKSHAQKLAEMAGVVRVLPSTIYKMQTTRSWDFLGLSSSPSQSSNLLHRGKMGEDVVIGVVDTGIWPESEAFRDEGMGPVPSRWKGKCESGTEFNSTNCNRKIIGARWYNKGFIVDVGQEALANEYLSARDFQGHGTHVASTAAGSFVPNVNYQGLGAGTVRGGAPRARLAIYKAFWSAAGQGSAADILMAIDQAIHDGVDVLSLSLTVGRVPISPEFSEDSVVAIGSFHATARGISVVCAGGNDGPNKQTILNTAPWIFTVAASTMDRAFVSSITLGDDTTHLGQSLFTAKNDIGGNLVCSNSLCSCEGILRNDTSLSGNVVLCFSKLANVATLLVAAATVEAANGTGIIVAGQHDDIFVPCGQARHFPCIVVDPDVATKIYHYFWDVTNPTVTVRLGRATTVVGKPISTNIAFFSSRGPNSASPAILKPDIAAPGSNILAAVPPHHRFSDKGFAFDSGTSMAAPHISGIVALLKSMHPTWSPAAIRSAISTTARVKGPSGAPILAESSPPKLADPFDYGGGLVNPNAAADPGLIYDLAIADYVKYYLCGMGYKNSDISQLTEQKTLCPSERSSVLDLNLPSITIPALRNSTTVTRTVTNVGNLSSVYRAVIRAPYGTKVNAEPSMLAFNPTVKKISFKVTISASIHRNYGYSFGSLIWSDGVHHVKIPLSVRTDLL